MRSFHSLNPWLLSINASGVKNIGLKVSRWAKPPREKVAEGRMREKAFGIARKSEIGTFLHLKSEIGRSQIGRTAETSRVASGPI